MGPVVLYSFYGQDVEYLCKWHFKYKKDLIKRDKILQARYSLNAQIIAKDKGPGV